MTPTTSPMHLDLESCYRAVKSRDRRFDGVFYTAVRTTGIYCRPSCPARTPAFHNVTFHPTAAAAQAAGYRACKRCLPDATPGSPDWDVAADVAGRAMRLIADGVVDRDGVDGLAGRIGYTPRHLSRILTQELGAGPLALARAKRAQTARVLLETTDLGAADVAFAAGLQQRPAVQRDDPRGVRRDADPGSAAGAARARRAAPSSSGWPCARRSPAAPCSRSSPPAPCPASRSPPTRRTRAPCGCPTAPARSSSSSPTTPTSWARRSCRRRSGSPTCATSPSAVERARRLVDADCDPVAIRDAFAGDPVLGARCPRSSGSAGARPRRRRRARRPRRARAAGDGRGGAHGRGAGSPPSTASRSPTRRTA